MQTPDGHGRRAGCSEVEHQVVMWLCAADQHLIAVRYLQRRGSIVDAPGQQRRDACVTDAGTARPSRWYVACLSEFEYGTMAVGPACGETAAREGDLWAGSRWSCRGVRC